MLPEEIYRARQTREIDRVVIEQHGVPGITLMRRAGAAAFKRMMERYSRVAHLVVVCGPGNNGGDGYVVALCARQIGIRVTVLAVGGDNTGDAATACRDYHDHGGITVAVEDAGAVIASADLLVDALFGTGLSRAPQGDAAEVIARINQAGAGASGGVPVVSLDMPSGLHSDTGFAFSPCVVADTTVTFIGVKLGLLTGRGRSHAGEIVFEDLRIPAEARRAAPPAARIIQPPVLAKRAREMHKGDAGRVLVVGGERGMLGAVLLAGEAALRCGSGLVTLAGDAAHLDLAALHRPELMSADAARIAPEDVSALADVVVLGPGLGQSEWSERIFERFIHCDLPMVVDADGLNWLARARPRQRANRVLTPHPGEAARLLQSSPADIQADRPAAAAEIVARFGGVCVLKGAGTLVAHADGALWLCDRGNPGMASAGMGDVLSGIVASTIGQGMPAADAATAAVWLHASAADIAAGETGERSVLARDVIARLPPLIRRAESK